jgi:hypothetical protein
MSTVTIVKPIQTIAVVPSASSAVANGDTSSNANPEDVVNNLVSIQQSLSQRVQSLNQVSVVQAITALFALIMEVPFGLLRALSGNSAGYLGSIAFAITSLIEVIDASVIGLRTAAKSQSLNKVIQQQINPSIQFLQENPNLSPQEKNAIYQAQLNLYKAVSAESQQNATDHSINKLVSVTQLAAGLLIAAGFMFNKKRLFHSMEGKPLVKSLQSLGERFERIEDKLNNSIAKRFNLNPKNVHSFEYLMAGVMALTGVSKLTIANGMPSGPLKQATVNEAQANLVCMFEAIAQIFTRLNVLYAVFASGSLIANAIPGLTSQRQAA